MWRQIERLAREIKFSDRQTQEFVEVSATYGRIKYEIIQQAWTVLLYAQQGQNAMNEHRPEVTAAIGRYDALWAEWRQLEAAHPSCASIHKDVGFDYHPGLGAAINRYRIAPGGR